MDREKPEDVGAGRRELKTTGGRERSRRKGACVDPVDALVSPEEDEMRKYEKASSALEVPQGAAVHPAGTPDDVTARHGTRSFCNGMARREEPLSAERQGSAASVASPLQPEVRPGRMDEETEAPARLGWRHVLNAGPEPPELTAMG